MFEGALKSTGWGYVGSGERGFEWLFTPDSRDPAYSVDPGTGRLYPFSCCRSGRVFKNQEAAIRDGKRWMKQSGRSGSITAVDPIPKHFEY